MVRYDSKENVAKFHIPEEYLKCRHFARRVPRLRGGWCLMVDDGYTNDCLLVRE